MLCLLLLAFVYVGISVIDQDVDNEDGGDIDDELEAAKLAGKKKKSKKNKKKKMDEEDILMEIPTADGLYFLCVEYTLYVEIGTIVRSLLLIYPIYSNSNGGG